MFDLVPSRAFLVSLVLPIGAAAQDVGVFSEQAVAAGVAVLNSPTIATNLCAGGAVGDFDRDGYEDFFFATGGGGPDKLFLNNGDGTFTDRAAEWGCALAHGSSGAAAGDFDGDGFLDIYVTSHGTPTQQLPGLHKLYRNVGGTHFEEVAQQMGVNFTSAIPDGWGASWGDYDLDGDLDLAVPGYRPPGGNRLFRNDGTHFTDVTVSAGLSPSVDPSFGFTVKFVDMDGDRYPELLWVSDFGTSRYFVNNGDGTFTDFTTQSGTGLEDTEMGVTVNDFNEDGLLDFYVTTVEENSFFINQGNHVFVDLSVQAGVRNNFWGWGAVSFDFNHDAKVDIIGTCWEGIETAFRNISPTPGQLLFDNVTELNGLSTVAGPGSGRGLSAFDYDLDGDQDMVVFNWFRQLELIRNDLAPGPNRGWLRVQLDRGCSTSVAPDGVGAIVRARIGSQTQTRILGAGSNYLSNSEFSVHFGLGTATAVDELRIEWPDGQVQILQNVAGNRHLKVVYPSTTPCFTPIGPGCNGVGTVAPSLTARVSTPPALGATALVDGTDLPMAASMASLLVSFDPAVPAAIALDGFGAPGCDLHLPPSAFPAIMAPVTAGTATWSLAIPNLTVMREMPFGIQAVAMDASANALGIVLSNALTGRSY